MKESESSGGGGRGAGEGEGGTQGVRAGIRRGSKRGTSANFLRGLRRLVLRDESAWRRAAQARARRSVVTTPALHAQHDPLYNRTRRIKATTCTQHAAPAGEFVNDLI